MQECTLDHNTFSATFENDLKAAKRSVMIQSPFVSARGIARLIPALSDLKNRHVQVCVFAKEPIGWHNPSAISSLAEKIALESFEEAINTLRALNVHVNVRSRIHEKVIVVDFSIIYDGSMNVLSYNPNFTSERMTRFINAYKGLTTIARLSLDSCSDCIHPNQISPEQLVLTDNTIGKIISATRKACGITQISLAEKCKTTRQNLGRIETGKVIPPLEMLIDIFDVLGYSLVVVPKFAVPFVAEIVRLVPTPFTTPDTLSTQTDFTPPQVDISQLNTPGSKSQGIPGSLIHD